MEFFMLLKFLLLVILFLKFKNFFLLMLMSMEFIFLNIMLIMLFYNMSMMFILYFMVICVCESVLGLSLLVIYIRFKGNDKLKILNLILW